MAVDAWPNIRLSKDELRPFLEKSDWAGFRGIATAWGLIALSLIGVGLWPNPLTVLLALIVIGGRQLALGIIMHDCAHNALFKTRVWNERVGQYLCAYPLLTDIRLYWKIHAAHHRDAGTPQDPDLPNYQSYPVSRASLRRKFIRDLTGQTGIKILIGIFKSGSDFFSHGRQIQTTPFQTNDTLSLKGPFVANALFFLILLALGHGTLYLLWIGAYLTTYMLFMRIRQIAEHAAVPNLFDPDPRAHTRTTIARFWERLTVAPHYVNYHLEHHLFSSVPPYHLPALHRLLIQKGAYANTVFPTGYGEILRLATATSS